MLSHYVSELNKLSRIHSEFSDSKNIFVELNDNFLEVQNYNTMVNFQYPIEEIKTNKDLECVMEILSELITDMTVMVCEAVISNRRKWV